jgi:hypothetical protein
VATSGNANGNRCLVKKEGIIVEVKKTRSNLRDNEIGKELIVDIERYKARDDCKFVYCFVYDPDHYIRNPAGLEELSRNEGELIVKLLSNQSGRLTNILAPNLLRRSLTNSGQNCLVDLLKHIIRHPCFILRWSIQFPDNKVARKDSAAARRWLHVVFSFEPIKANLVFDIRQGSSLHCLAISLCNNPIGRHVCLHCVLTYEGFLKVVTTHQ